MANSPAPPRHRHQAGQIQAGLINQLVIASQRGQCRDTATLIVMLDAQHYRQQAEQMRKFAQDERNAATREQFLNLAAEYEKLALRAEKRAAESK